MKKLFCYLTVLHLLSIPTISTAATVGEVIDPTDTFLDCSIGSPAQQFVCNLVKDRINIALQNANITINFGDILYVYRDGEDVPIDTGNDCTYTANITDLYASAKFTDTASLDFRFDLLSGPFVFALDLPIELYTRADMEAWTGIDMLLYCAKSPFPDKFYGDASLATRAKMAIFFSLEPKLAMAPNGDYVVSIQPIVDVASTLENTDVTFDLHNVSPFTGCVRSPGGCVRLACTRVSGMRSMAIAPIIFLKMP